jgi:undecaprenyl phosphate N,N'-diacetylbacillosamine 1-phosphate transferase
MLINIIPSMYNNFIKSFIDFGVSLIVIIALSPLLIITTIINFFVIKDIPFFYQVRPGKQEKEIKIIKFKSMNDKKDNLGNLLPDKDRMTSFGSFLRKTSIDELPQLFNVIKGEMSLIGPRPLLFKYIPLYSEEQKKRHLVKPGITGWAQVNGRNSISWTEKFNLDIYYVENMSFLLDIKIIWLTFLKVVKSEGVNQSNERPMTPFTGNN